MLLPTAHPPRLLLRNFPFDAARVALCMVFMPCGLTTPGSVRAENDTASTSRIVEHFEKYVRPILAEHCYSCHSTQAKKLSGELRLDSRTAVLRGGESGVAVVPGHPDESLLIEAVRYESYEMPPRGKLSNQEIEHLERWVHDGAYWPDEPEPIGTTASENRFDLQARKESHWAWQPITNPQPPTVRDPSWSHTPIDQFVLAKLEASGLAPAADANPTTLLRRLYFDIIGLPPTIEQIENFLADSSADRLMRVVDELLESPHFGERWGRHWLDLARYAESRGHEFDNDAVNAFQYRDYVIRALNADVPYDQFVREQIAGDLLDEPRLHPQQEFNESILGTGFWFLGEWVHSPVDIRKDETDRFDNMIDVMSKTFLGVTVACARCHDHKFDAISTADYYALSGFLQSSDYRQVRFESMEKNRRVSAELEMLDQAFQRRIKALLPEGMINAISNLADLPPQEEPSVVVDYQRLAPNDFMQDGYIFGQRPRRAGDLVLAFQEGTPSIELVANNAAVNDPIWNGLISVSQQAIQNRSKLATIPRSGRTLRTPTFLLTDGTVHCLIKGQGHVVACVDSHRLIAGPLHGETVVAIKGNSPWVTMNLGRYVGHRVHLEFTPAENEPLQVHCVAQGSSRETQDRLVVRQQEIHTLASDVSKQLREFVNSDSEIARKARELIVCWADQRSKLKNEIVHVSRLAMAMMDGTSEDDHVLIRGNSDNPGKVEPRHFLTAISGNSPLSIRTRSGRLELAQCINDDANPLTARVIANRIWHHLMGRGIVPTTEDFGVLGLRPTHPDLLDHLATRFRQDGQSIKRMIRYIVSSRVYQMSGRSDANTTEADPKNLLWHHRPPKRLEGEVIRDSLLSISGRLNAKAFGEPVPIHLTSFMDGRGRPSHSGPLDGDSRRSIYTGVRRNFLSPFMLTFDTPVPFSSMGRRNVSNVPAQSLILLNDPFVIQQSRHWAEHAIHQISGGDDVVTARARIVWLYQTGFGRLPSESEQDAALEFCLHHPERDHQARERLNVWADLAHALVNAKEFVFLR